MFKKVKEENFYLITMLLVGLLLIFIVPPFNSPDEDSHFKKAYLVANGIFYPDAVDGSAGNEISINLADTIDAYKSFGMDYNKKYNYHQFLMDMQTLKISDEKKFYEYSTAKVNPVMYIVPASGIIISNLFSKVLGINSTITGMLYGARLMSLLIYSIVIYFAIKMSPKFKKSLLLMSLLPMTMFLISCVTYDSLLIVATFLLVGLVLNLRYSESKLETRHLIMIGCIAFVYINLKYIYIFNLLLLLLIPFKKVASNKNLLKKSIIVVLIVMFAFILTNYNILTLKGIVDSSLPGEQVKYVLKNPTNYVKTYFSTLLNNRFFYITTTIGVFGLLDTYMPTILYLIYFIIAIIILLTDCNEKVKEKSSITLKYKILIILMSFGMISLSFLAMYVNWTSIMEGYGVGATSITGVQGRYFIPAIIPLAIVFANNFKWDFLEKIKKIISDNYGYVFVFYSLIMISMIILRFWM